MTRPRLSSVVVLGLVGLILLIPAVPARAQEPPPKISVTLEPSSRPELADVLAAHLTAPDGRAISEASVRFSIRAEMLGERYALVAEAVTDSSGVARYPFIPHRETYEIRATFDGNELWGPAEVITPVTFRPERVVAYQGTDPTQLGSLRFVMPRLMGVVLGLIWAALIGLAFFTLRSFKRMSPGS